MHQYIDSATGTTYRHYESAYRGSMHYHIVECMDVFILKVGIQCPLVTFHDTYADAVDRVTEMYLAGGQD